MKVKSKQEERGIERSDQSLIIICGPPWASRLSSRLERFKSLFSTYALMCVEKSYGLIIVSASRQSVVKLASRHCK